MATKTKKNKEQIRNENVELNGGRPFIHFTEKEDGIVNFRMHGSGADIVSIIAAAIEGRDDLKQLLTVALIAS